MRRTRCEQQQQNNHNGLITGASANSAATQPMLIIADRQHGSTLIPSNNHSNLPAINGLTTATVPNGGGTSKYSNYNTVIAWGVPALQTVAVLVARFVDADELLGEIGIFYCWFAFPLGGSFSLARRHSSL